MGYSREEKALLWLDSLFPVDYARKEKIRALGGSAYALVSSFPQFERAIVAIAGEENFAAMRLSLQSPAYLNDLLERYAHEGIECITAESSRYPENLRKIERPPFVLYCKGNTQLLAGAPKLTIVGSRRTLPPVTDLTRRFAEALSEKMTIVSGLADGADSAAVRGALQNANVISVLASGFAHVYPECNRSILEEVIRSGLAVTEYPPDVSPQKYLFPVRNRILAGLSDGTLVVSGSEKSGTRHTARFASENGRKVFAFPYNIGVESGAVCNNIIKQGGKLVDNLVDITAAFGIHLTEKEKIELTAEEEAVLAVLRGGEAHVSQLAARTGKKTFELQPVLTALEIKKMIVDCGGNRYCAVR